MARQRKRKGDPVHGWLNFNKPVGMTSTQAVGFVKRVMHAQKAGHGGTLDPLADGILPIALGEATKTSAYAMESDKDYTFHISWGASTSTQDREGDVIAESDVRPEPDAVAEILSKFVGEIDQVPPKFSAIKVNGERAYDLARDGEEVELQPRKVELFGASLDPASTPETAIIHVTCGKGFYIRALVRDLACELGAEGHVTVLKRTRVGAFDIRTSTDQATLEAAETPEDCRGHLIALDAPLDDIPKLEIQSSQLFRLRNGNDVQLLPHELEQFRSQRMDLQGDESEDRLALIMEHGQAVALGEIRAGRFQPIRVFQL
ncbi:MAG: tRNA pseudouridine(55) synthase TruB [Ponticaulis sp.]|nr:tRNA pseudouridine(55) synthase TruB [Ponticaulis sp.]